MTKAELDYILQRYRIIKKAMKEKKHSISFYIGKRKEVIVIDDKIKAVFSIINDLMHHEKPMVVSIMRYWFKLGYGDIRILSMVPLSRSSYYRIKRTIENKIYQCCIFRGLVSYDELMNERIG